MIQKVVESLNTGKAADEHGLKAEHFKNSPHAIYINTIFYYQTQ
jgi:hypothetical protein